MLRTHLLQNVCRSYMLRTAQRGIATATPATVSATNSAKPRYAMAVATTRTLPSVHGYASVARAPAFSNKKRAPKANNGAAGSVSIEDLWTQLEAFYQQHSLVRYENCERIIQQLEAVANDEKLPLSAQQLHFLLGICVPELLPAQTRTERLALFQRLWSQLLKVEQPKLAHYYTQLEMLQQNQLPLPNHQALLAEIAVYNGAADATLYSALLDVAGASGNMRQVTELLSEMRALNMPLTERNFHALLLGHGRSGDLAGMDKVLVGMRAGGISPTASTQALCFVLHVENAQLAKAQELLQQHEQQLQVPQLLQMLRAVVSAEHVNTQLMEQLLALLPAEYINDTDVPAALNALGMHLLHQQKATLMMQLVAALPAPQFTAQQNQDGFGALLLQELFRARTPLEQMLQFAAQLRQSGQNPRALQLLAELALRRQPSLALSCLQALHTAAEPLRPHYFWPLLLQQHKREGERGVLHVLGEMQQLQVQCDEETLRLYVLPLLQQTLQQPPLAMQQLDAVGVRASLTLEPLLAQLLQQQQTTEALQLLQQYPTRLRLTSLLQPLAALGVHARATKSYAQFAQLLQALQQRSLQRKEDFVGALLLQMCAPQTRLRQEPTALLRLLHELQRLQLHISPAAAESLLAVTSSWDASNAQAATKALQLLRSKELTLPPDTLPFDGFIKHPRDMTLDELECHLVELEAKQLNTRGVLRRLLQLNVRDGRLERALQLEQKCQQLKVQVSAGMLASILELHIKLKQLPRAQQTLQQLAQSFPAFQLDEHKLLDYAALLVEGEQLTLAKQLLEQRAAAHKIHGGDYVIKNVWQLLNSVAQLASKQPVPESGRTLTNEIFEFLRTLGYCQTHNALLGPLVREWLLRGDLAGAVAEFQRLATRYKHTPLQFELLSLLVSLSNGDEQQLARYASSCKQSAQQQLAEVTATVSRVHGAANMNSALLLALAESGTETQLRRLIINPEFQLNHQLLLKNCEHLGQEGAVRTLLRLARGVRGLQRTIDEQAIYDMLLAKFSKSNNYEAALDLYERLQADDELKVSQDFVRNLAKLLQLNNVEIPSSIALRAQIR
ncbi:CG14786 [Drosophila busckii]|uniref:CG14786 n=1 Tax=Drosophila busckii TaxID=30019 RepID=A0A0M4EX50_DROBS|nr:leucine-rich PPR motif-containing protein, mitochondrial [Drosophila busckii]ALC48217.1 CG14786 [Drosophila busckii]